MSRLLSVLVLLLSASAAGAETVAVIGTVPTAVDDAATTDEDTAGTPRLRI